MFANFFKNLIVRQFGSYIEDFTSQDIAVDTWNGQVVKDNVTIKKSALENIGMRLFGAPLVVVKGYIKKLRIDIPWNKILSKPCEVLLDDIHIVLKPSASFDPEFAKRMIWKARQGQFEELLDQVRKQKALKEDESDTYMKRLTKIITENLRIVATNVHIRFEDNLVSRPDSQFNMGIVLESLNYSMTNSSFERVFLNLDDKKQEQRSFSMLELKQAAFYWNPNSLDNWSTSREFASQSAAKIIEQSRKYVEALKKRHHQFKLNMSTSSAFVVQPFDIRARFRKNLGAEDVPRSTTAIDMTALSVTLDEEVYKDLQYLTKLFAWHSKMIEQKKHFKFRPAYNVPVTGNARVYWDYAIQATIYHLRKGKRERHLRAKRQQEIIELSQLYVMSEVNQYYETHNQQQRLLKSGDVIVPSEEALQLRIVHLETKLIPEQMIMAYLRAESPIAEVLKQEQENQGWRSWIPGVFKGSRSQQPEQQELEKAMDAYQSYEQLCERDELLSESDRTFDYTSPHMTKVHSHFSVSIPRLEIALVTKKQGSYSKYFMQVVLREIMFQSLSFGKEKSQLFSLDNLEVIDKLAERQKFAKAFMKKELGGPDVISPNKKVASVALVRSNERREIEEEADLNKNNGLPLIKMFEQLVDTGSSKAPILVFQMSTKTESRRGQKKTQYRIDVFLNAFSVFYNRLLISRAQTFINQATVNRIQNAAAEADFESSIENFKTQTQEKMTTILEKNEVQVLCNAQGMEILVPDCTAYEASKFIQLQTGGIVLKNGEAHTQASALQAYVCSHRPEYAGSLEVKSADEYQFTVCDFQVLYIPNATHLENLQYPDPDLSRYSLLRHTEITIYVRNDTEKTCVSTTIGQLQLQMTNKELKELKHFFDSFKKYHYQINLEVQRELKHIEMMNRSIQQFEQDYKRLAGHDSDGEEEVKQSFVPHQRQRLRSQNSSMLIAGQQESREFLDALSRNHQSRETTEDNDDDEQFFDTHDVFDADVIQMLNLDQNLQKVKHVESPISKPVGIRKRLLCDFWLKSLSLSIHEEVNLAEDLTQGLRQRLGSFGPEQIEFNIKYKGVQFLQLEIHKAGVLVIDDALTFMAVRQVQLNHFERFNQPKAVVQSYNCELDNFFSEVQTPTKLQRKPIYDFEDEEQATREKVTDDIDEFFFKATLLKGRAEVELGMITLSLDDILVAKAMDTLVMDFPVSEQAVEPPSVLDGSELVLCWEGIDATAKVRNEITGLKVTKVKCSKRKGQSSIFLDDIKLTQGGQELVFKESIADDESPMVSVEQGDNSMIVSLSNAVLNLDIALIDTLSSNCLKLGKAMELEDGPKEPSNKVVKPLTLQVTSSYLQVPLKDSKNCLYTHLQGLSFSQEQVSFHLFHIYIARSFEQRTKYTFAMIQNLKRSRQSLELGMLAVKVNENFLLHFANVLEQHFEDAIRLMHRFKKDRPIQQDAEEPSHLVDEQPIEVCTDEKFPGQCLSVMECSVETIRVEWIFGQGFDDHEDNFVTLFNKNFSQQILSQFDSQQPEFEMIDTSSRPKKEKETATQYEILRLDLTDICFQRRVHRIEDKIQSQMSLSLYSFSIVNSLKDGEEASIVSLRDNINSMQIREEPALSFRVRETKSCEVDASSIEITFSNTNARVITALAKSLYSCKNVLKRGRKRDLIRSLVQGKQAEQEKPGFQEVKIVLKSWKVVVGHQEEEKRSSSFVKKLGSSLGPHQPSASDSLIIEGAMNFNRLGHEARLEVKQMEAYMCIKEGERLQLIHPLDLLIIKQGTATDMEVSLLECELTLKQGFHLIFMFQQIQAEFVPLLQLLKHSLPETPPKVENEAERTKLQIGQLYVTLLKESKDPFFLHEGLCQPLFSLELKKFGVSHSQARSQSLIKTYMVLELYYFNDKLNFYEPLIESTKLHANLMSDALQNVHLELELNNILNINFSVALCSTVSTLLSALDEERNAYQGLDTGVTRKQRRDIDFNPSLFCIKNSTGEVLWFKTQSQSGFSELQAEETKELDFEVENGRRDLERDQEEEDSKADPKAESKPVSRYRREHLRYLRGQPKKVFFLLSEKVFEVNMDSLTCQRLFLDEQRQLYVICQTQTKNGVKQLLIRSPMQITNNLQIPIEVELVSRLCLEVKPEQSVTIPLKACSFSQVRVRPFIRREDGLFDWTDYQDMSLLQDDREIFEKKPVVLVSSINQQRDPGQKYNNRVFMMLNANVYSIRSFLDFNTQQTDFISVKYLSVSPPFIVQNLLPVALSVLVKNAERDLGRRDQRQYKLEMKMNSSIQSLFLNPLGNMDLALCILGFDNSNFVPLKVQGEEDFFKDPVQDNYIDQMLPAEPPGETQLPKNPYRFLKQKKMLFQMTSRTQTQLNVCANFAFIQGCYHISFYAKYWFLNNTQMPLSIQMKTESFDFDMLDLPFESMDYDFETVKRFMLEAPGKDKSDRKLSLDSFKTETHKSVKSGLPPSYQELVRHLQRANPHGQTRMKPWEAYKINQDDSLGLIGALTDEDISRVSSIHMAEELDAEDGARKHTVRFLESESGMEEEKEHDRFTSRTRFSIQMSAYAERLNENKLVPLNQLGLSQQGLFESPLRDPSQTKRVVLFSDSPVEEQAFTSQDLLLKICDSEWSSERFDIAKLQGASILLRDQQRQSQPQSLYEIVAKVQYLPAPFSFSKLVSFHSKYILVNKTALTLYVTQADCEERGQFKVFPFETSPFHWTDSKKRQEVAVKLEGFEYSGNFRIDTIGEMSLRLRSDVERMVLNVSINEDNSAFMMVVSDVSYMPPYRIENLTKTAFKLSQKDSRSDDFDILKPYQIAPFAWSYPLCEKLLSVAICYQDQDVDLGFHKIDAARKSEKRAVLRDRRGGKEFVLEIANEKNITVVRILYAQNAVSQQSLIKKQAGKEKQFSVKTKAFPFLGISLVSSQAREIVFVHFKDIAFSFKKCHKNRKLSLKLGEVQIDNQLVRQKDAIILKRKNGEDARFLKLKIHQVVNESIDNLMFFKQFIVELAPFDLKLDGNFCDEFYKYTLEIAQGLHRDQPEPQPDKKPDQLQAPTKVYFEHLYVNEIKFNFSFSSSPILFREFSMNPTVKFLIVLLSNMKNVQLKFASYQLRAQQMPTEIFASQLQKAYVSQCYHHKQVFQIVTSMGILGNISSNMQEMQLALKRMANDLSLTGLVTNSARFCYDVGKAGFVSAKAILESFKSGMAYLLTADQPEKPEFEDLGVRELTSFSSPVGLIDTQNKIWFKIITREKQNYDEKKHLYKPRPAAPKGLFRAPAMIGKVTEKLMKEERQQKVRPPRFVNFRMELEPYNEQKALALQYLNDINMGMFMAETIEKIFNFSKNTMIMTGRRLILGSAIRDNKNVVYKSWNLLYKDIMRYHAVLFDLKHKRQITQAELDQLIDKYGHDSPQLSNITIVLNVYYHGAEEGDQSIGDLRMGEHQVKATVSEMDKLGYFTAQLHQRMHRQQFIM